MEILSTKTYQNLAFKALATFFIIIKFFSGLDKTAERSMLSIGGVETPLKASAKDQLKVWPCVESCLLPEDWAEALHTQLSILPKTFSNSVDLQFLLLSFEECPGCEGLEYPQCQKGEKCLDIFKLLRKVKGSKIASFTTFKSFVCKEY